MLFDAHIVVNTAAAHAGAYEIGFSFYSHELIRSVWRLLSPLAVFGAFAAWAWQQRRFGLYWLYF
ncbi:MAG TPA: hypothetical protein VKA19_13185 [Alphaproteobacteria bacterium]|nr:hypothetical protein [Alphaproteobacteria bacterium]